jgi:hypothetical protein
MRVLRQVFAIRVLEQVYSTYPLYNSMKAPFIQMWLGFVCTRTEVRGQLVPIPLFLSSRLWPLERDAMQEKQTSFKTSNPKKYTFAKLLIFYAKN